MKLLCNLWVRNLNIFWPELLSGCSDRTELYVKKMGLHRSGESVKYNPGGCVLIDSCVCAVVYNFMRKDFTTLESYHGLYHFMFCCVDGEVIVEIQCSC